MNSEQRMRNSHRFGRALWIGLTTAWVLATVGCYLFLDSAVSRRLWDHPINWQTNAWVNAFRQLGRAGVPIWLVAIWSCLTNKWRPTVVVMTAMVLVAVSVCSLKAIVRRPRPIHTLTAAAGQPQPEIRWQKRVSFPSGDATVVFAAATALSFSWRRLWAPVLFLIAGAIGVLRVTALAHYPSDVMAAALIGAWCGATAVWWTGRWWPPDQFRLEGWWRLVLALALIFVLPFVAPYLGNGPALSIFLGKFALPLLVVILGYVALVRLRTRRPVSGETET